MLNLCISPISTDLVSFPRVKSDITLAGELKREANATQSIHANEIPDTFFFYSYRSGHTHDSYSVRNV